MPFVLRLLLPLLAALALLGQPIASYASAGASRASRCCCPDPDKCTCHDHGGPRGESSVKRCGSGPTDVITPVVLTALAPEVAPPRVAPRAVMAAAFVPPSLVDRRADRPEKPPS